MFTREIGSLMARIASHAVDAVAIFATLYVLQVDMTVVALKGRIARGMAVLAARKGEDFVDLQECLAGGVCIWLRL